MLGGHNDVDIVLAAQAMVHGGQQAVGIRRQIDADDIRLFVCDVVHEPRILVREAVVVLLPDGGAHDQVERRDLLTPGELVADLQPFCVLRRHGVDDSRKTLVGREKSVSAGQEVALEPALAHMLGQHGIHDTAVRIEMVVRVEMFGVPVAVLHVKNMVQPVGVGLIRPEDAEILRVVVQLEDVTHELAELGHVLPVPCAVLLSDVEGIVAEIRHTQIAQQLAAVAVRIGSDTVLSGRRERRQLRQEMSLFIEQLLRMVTVKPVRKNLQMLRLVHHDRDLMRQEVPFDPVAVDHLRPGPALRRAQHDHRPHRPRRVSCLPRVLLNRPDGFDDGIHRLRHLPVHRHRIVTFDKIRLPPAAMEEVRDLLMAHAGKNRRIRDLISVQMQNRQHRTVADRIQEFVGLPARGKRTGFRLAVADRDRRNQIRIVEDRSECVCDGIAQLAALIDRTRRLRRAVRRHAARERELLEQLLHAGLVLRDVRIHLTVGAVEIIIRNIEISAVSGPGEQNQVQIVPLDCPVQMHEDKILSRHRAPVSDDLLLDHIPGQPGRRSDNWPHASTGSSSPAARP